MRDHLWMTAAEYRHKLTPEQARLTDRELAQTLPEGTGISVLRYTPFWDVVIIHVKDGKYGYIVTDSSRPGRKPLNVFGPSRSREEAVTFARSTAETWRATHVMMPEWPWE